MCGIVGIIHLNQGTVDREVLKKMSDTLAWRGPDAEGFFYDGGVGLAHRRLSIIDIESGQQPMLSDSGDLAVVFNGEIYNFLELKNELTSQGVVFRTHSDTEVLLKGYEKYGKKIVEKLNGMFAFAIWHKSEKKLFCARDRLGEKPFYYAFINNTFLFASELKALLQHPSVEKKINPSAINYFFTYEFVPAPFSIIDQVYKLPQAHTLEFSASGVSINRYWHIPLGERCNDNEKVASRKVYDLLNQAVSYRLIADVPLGIFLSGGLDSSALVSLVAGHREGKNIPTFSIEFEEASYDEGFFSSEVAKKFGTDHHTEILSAQKMLDILPRVVDYGDEPFADTSILPTFLLAQFTRQHVKVALGGDGADELFAGYPTFFANQVADWYQKTPAFLKRLIESVVNFLPASDKNMSFDFKARQFLNGATQSTVLRNQAWLAAISTQQESQFYSPHHPKITTTELIETEMRHCLSQNAGDRMLYFYQKFYLCDDILVKTDRASMANSLEVRAPFLDHHLVEYVSRLPYELKLKGVTSKYILKKAFHRQLPAMITQRKKKGFGAPIAPWLKKELKPILCDHVNQRTIESDGYFQWPFIEKMMKDHFAGRVNHRKPLFALLMFQLWKQKWLG